MAATRTGASGRGWRLVIAMRTLYLSLRFASFPGMAQPRSSPRAAMSIRQVSAERPTRQRQPVRS